MQNFIFHNPVKIYFGKGQIENLPREIPLKHRILFIYGLGSIKCNGVYEQIKAALREHDVLEFGGIEPNPSYENLMPAVQIIKEKNIDFILAAGGGSVLDGAKFIAAAAHFDGEPWDILSKHAAVSSALPFGCILTLPAAGSEMNCGAVISKKSSRDKLGFGSACLYPKFSILDPAATYSLPVSQTANGIIDTFVHVLEQYLTYRISAPLQDRFSESILSTLIHTAPKVLQDPGDYDARAVLMWCSTMALNDVIATGVPEDWTAHTLGHEVTACYGLDHGQTLAVIMPAVMQVRRKQKREKLLQYAERIFSISEGDEESRIDAAIHNTRDFFAHLGVKLFLKDYGIDKSAIQILLQQLQRHGFTCLGEKRDIGLEEIEMIYRLSVGD